MTVKDLERLYDYGYWANRKLVPVIASSRPNSSPGTSPGSYGSVRNTLVHIMSAEWGWLDRCGGYKRGPALKPEDYPTQASLLETWTMVETHVRNFLASLADADLQRSVEFKMPGSDQTHVMQLGDLMQHAATHAVHHRGQVALLLRALGHVPGNFDVLIYDLSRRARCRDVEPRPLMFIGHLALGFAAKRAAPRVSLAVLFSAAQLADILWPVFIALGVEQVRIVPGFTAFTPFDFVSYPYSHSLVFLIGWGVAFGLVYRWLTGNTPRRGDPRRAGRQPLGARLRHP